MANSKKKMNNITTVKVNPFEIAKATDMDFGFKNVLANFSILADWFYGFHLGEIDEKLFKTPLNVGASNQDFIIGGGFVSAGDTTLRVLPVLACSKEGGLFITNGLDVDNRPIEISFGSGFASEGFRIESVFIGNAETGTWDGSTAIKDKKDPNWDDYQSEWRASYRLLQGSEETVFSEFKKRQMQAVRFYIYPGIIRKTGEEAKAADVSKVDAFRERVKIAEVLVHCKLDAGNVPRIQPIKQEDVRFVTARTYFDGTFAEAVKKDDRWLGRGKTEAEKTERAEHYNRLWTSEHLRTYRLGSVSEISERIDKIHKKDGTLKEEVVWNRHINLNPSDENSLRGDLIPIGQPDSGSGKLDIPLRYDKKIKSAESIKQGMNNTADVLNEHIDRTQDVHGATIEPVANRIVIRDTKGQAKVNAPAENDSEGVVNVGFLNRHFDKFQLDIILIVLKSKLITTQTQYNNWINAGKDDAYTYVYIKGQFVGGIDGTKISTKKITCIGNTEITGSIKGANYFDIYSDYELKITLGYISGVDLKNVKQVYVYSNQMWGIIGCGTVKNANVKVDCDGKAIGIAECTVQETKVEVSGRDAIGFEYCITRDCTAFVSGVDGVDGSSGGNAIGFDHCTVTRGMAYCYGGKGGKGRSGRDADNGGLFIGIRHATNGGNGGNGGNAYSFMNCNINSKPVYEYAEGGNGGKGGYGGESGYIVSRAGNGGNGGNGGNAYVLDLKNGKAGTAGARGDRGWCGNQCNKNGSHGSPGSAGKVIKIEF